MEKLTVPYKGSRTTNTKCNYIIHSRLLDRLTRPSVQYKNILWTTILYHGSSSKVGLRRVWNKMTNVAEHPTQS